MASVKKLYQRFKAWQREPRSYQDCGNEAHCCANCDFEYVGAFCPRCGQKARAGRITWSTVHRGIMDVWGLGGRSLPYSLWQLLWRPGYFISDYINGKWQASFPPVKMLVIVALVVFFIGRLLFPEYWAEFMDDEPTAITSTGISYYMDKAFDWMSIHAEWGFLFVFSLLILPTWYVFRHSPRNNYHTLPQGFFIQVFMTIQFIIWLFVLSLVFMVMGMKGSESAVIVSSILLPVMVLVDYKQLFGYGWWGTLWRLVSIVVLFVLFLLLLVAPLRLATKPISYFVEHHFRIVFIFLMAVSGLGTVMSLINVINRKLWRERGMWRSMVWPIVFFLLLTLSIVALEIQRPGGLIHALLK